MLIELALSLVAAAAGPHVLTPIRDAYPSLSPDGKTLLFQSTRSGRWALYTSKADGSEVKFLLDSGDDPVTASWSPDGAMIAFAATAGGESDIFVMKADGSDRQRLTDDPGDDSHPHWPADGRIFFNSARTTADRAADWSSQYHEVFSTRADGSDLRQHTQCKSVCTFPSPSPDGKLIAYRKVIAGPAKSWDQSESQRNSEVFVANLDGSNERNLSQHAAFDGWPVWSPDSNCVVFASNRDGAVNNGQVYAVRPDGSGMIALTEDDWSNVQPSLSPDGATLFTYRHLETNDYEFGHVSSRKVSF